MPRNTSALFVVSLSLLLTISYQCGPLTKKCSAPCSTNLPASGSCDFANIIAQHEGCCLCAYLDSLGKPTIGIGYLLDSSRSAELASIGANYNDLVSGKAGLTNDQVVQLFNKYVSSSISTARKYFSNYDSLCCNVQQGLIDMIYDLSNGIGAWNGLRTAIQNHQWQEAARSVANSKYCGQVGHRCTDDQNLIGKGCSGMNPTNSTQQTQPHTQPTQHPTSQNKTKPTNSQPKTSGGKGGNSGQPKGNGGKNQQGTQGNNGEHSFQNNENSFQNNENSFLNNENSLMNNENSLQNNEDSFQNNENSFQSSDDNNENSFQTSQNSLQNNEDTLQNNENSFQSSDDDGSSDDNNENSFQSSQNSSQDNEDSSQDNESASQSSGDDGSSDDTNESSQNSDDESSDDNTESSVDSSSQNVEDSTYYKFYEI